MEKMKLRVRKFLITQTPALWHLRVKMQGIFVSFFRFFCPMIGESSREFSPAGGFFAPAFGGFLRHFLGFLYLKNMRKVCGSSKEKIADFEDWLQSAPEKQEK